MLFGGREWTGFRSTGLDELLARVRANYRFRPRREVEDDPAEPQIIPYVVFRHDDRYFLTHRLRRSSERRLRHLYSLGVGGHINPEDVAGAADPIDAGLVEGDRPEISIREVEKLAGALLPLDAMRSYYLDMESWSQLIFDYLTGVPVG